MRIIANTTELDGMLRRVIGRLEQPEQALRAVGNLIYSLTLGAFDLSIGQRPARHRYWARPSMDAQEASAHAFRAVVDGAPAFYSAFPNVTGFVRGLLGL
jgi:hypothetical protein